MAPRRNFVFSASLGNGDTTPGDASWSVSDTFPNTAGEITSHIIAGLPNVSAPGNDGYGDYGKSGSAAGTSANITKTNAGNDTRLGGRNAWSSGSSKGFRVDSQAGAHDVWFAMGSSNNEQCMFVFDGTLTNLGLSITVSNLGLWKPTTATASTWAFICSSIDGSVWQRSSAVATVTGSTEPSGAGPTFNDGGGGGCDWTRIARDALIVAINTNTSATTIVDQNGDAINASDWAASLPVEATVSGTWGNALCFVSASNVTTQQVRCISIQAQQATLVDATLTDHYGAAQGTTPNLHAMQPLGFKAFEVGISAGVKSDETISFGGELGAYFEPVQVGDSVFAATAGARIPDSFDDASTHTLTVIQTDPAATGSPRTTTFDVTVISSEGRETTGVLGALETRHYLFNRDVKAIAETAYDGWQGEAFETDQPVSGATAGTDFTTALLAIPEDGNWHRIRLGDGVYEDVDGSAIHRDYAPGGVLIEVEDGADPVFNNSYADIIVNGIDFEGVWFGCNAAINGGRQFRTPDPGISGINAGGNFANIKINNCRLGRMFDPAEDLEDWSVRNSSFWLIDHGESVRFTNNRGYCLDNTLTTFGVRAVLNENNDLQLTTADNFAGANARDWTSTIGAFDDNDTYIYIKNPTVRFDPDYVGYVNLSHSDLWQTKTSADAAHIWQEAWKPGGDGWEIGNYTLSMTAVPPRIYIATDVVGAGLTGATPPTSDGTGITDGDITWDYVDDWEVQGATNVVIEGATILSNSPLSGENARQFFIDSNGGRGSTTVASVVDCLSASASGYGIQVSEGEVFAEYNTYARPPGIEDSQATNLAQIRCDDGPCLALHNVTMQDSSGGTSDAVDDEVIVEWEADAASPNLPAELLVGPFEQQAVTDEWQLAAGVVTNDGSTTAATFRAQMRAAYRSLSGTAGVWPETSVRSGGLGLSLSLSLSL